MIIRKPVDFTNFTEKINIFCASLPQYGSDLIAVYLFGSSARGEVKPLSDIDLAILLADNLTDHKIETKMFIEAMRIMETEEIDLITLNTAPLRIQYGVLRNKKVIYNSDTVKRIDFENRVIMEYLDFAPMRQMFNTEFLRNAGIGGTYNG